MSRATIIHRTEVWIDRFEARPRVGLCAFALLFVIQISPWWYETDDGTAYLSVARSIAEGGPLSKLGSRNIVVSPGYPILISPLFLADAQPFLGLSIFNCVCALALIAGVYRWAARLMPSCALTVTGVAVLNAAVWFQYRRTLKEIVFMAALVWSAELLAWIERAASSAAPSGDTRRPSAARLTLWSFAGGLAIAGLVLIRFTGAILAAALVAAVGWDLLARRMNWRRALLVSLAVSLPPFGMVAGLVSYQRTMAAKYGGTNYVAGLEGVHAQAESTATLLADGLRLRIADVGRVTVPVMLKTEPAGGRWFDPNMLLYLAIAGVIARGWRRLVSQRRDVLLFTMPLYLGVYAIWPFEQGARFAVPMLPVLMLCCWAGVSRWLNDRRIWLSLALAAHLGVALVYWIGIDAPRALAMSRDWPSVGRLAESIQPQHGAVLADGLPRPMCTQLQLAIDRPVYRTEECRGIPETVEWFVHAAEITSPAGFTTVRIVDGFAVSQRPRDPESLRVAEEQRARAASAN